jgi:hypothetical protein
MLAGWLPFFLPTSWTIDKAMSGGLPGRGHDEGIGVLGGQRRSASAAFIKDYELSYLLDG